MEKKKELKKINEDEKNSLINWLRDAEQIPEEGESLDEFIKRTEWTLKKENYWRKIEGFPLLKSEREYRRLFKKNLIKK